MKRKKFNYEFLVGHSADDIEQSFAVTAYNLINARKGAKTLARRYGYPKIFDLHRD